MELRLLISFDYEVFLGKNHASDDEVLFAPTRRLLALCDRLGVKVTFFADVCSVWAHREAGLNAYAEAFETQLKNAHAGGHDVELHLHPHWMFSKWDGREWLHDPNRLYLAECGFGDNPRNANQLVKRGRAYLEGLLGRGYRCCAFRAPGLVLQPQEDELMRALLDEGIRYESSVVKGIQVDSKTTRFDYRQVPRAPNWKMAPESGIGREASKGLYEVPIGTFRLRKRDRLRFLAQRAASVGQLRGSSITREERHTRLGGLAAMVANNLRYLGPDAWFSLSCDTKGFDFSMLRRGFEQYLSQHEGHERLAVSMINHPKLMFDRQLGLLAEFIEWARGQYRGALAITTYRGLDDEKWGQA